MAETKQTSSIASHLLELRTRLLRIVLAILLLAVGLFAFANELYVWLAMPLLEALPEGSQMIATDVASPFLTPFKFALVVAFFLAIPYILWEVWRFIAPGLFQHEKKLILPLLAFSVALFYLGVAFAYYVVFPVMFAFFSATGPIGVSYTPDIARFLDTVLKLFFAFGVAFEIPIVVVVLAYTGTVTAQSLVDKRPYIIVGCFIVAALLTPPDPISQCLMAIPMWILFELGVVFARIVQKNNSAETLTDH